MKKEDTKRKKERCGNLGDNEKEQVRKYESKGKKGMCDNFEAGEKEKVKKNDKKGKMEKRLKTLDERSSIFDNVQMCSMADPCILTVPAFLKKISRLPFRKVVLTFVIFVGNLNFEGMLLN